MVDPTTLAPAPPELLDPNLGTPPSPLIDPAVAPPQTASDPDVVADSDPDVVAEPPEHMLDLLQNEDRYKPSPEIRLGPIEQVMDALKAHPSFQGAYLEQTMAGLEGYIPDVQKANAAQLKAVEANYNLSTGPNLTAVEKTALTHLRDAKGGGAKEASEVQALTDTTGLSPDELSIVEEVRADVVAARADVDRRIEEFNFNEPALQPDLGELVAQVLDGSLTGQEAATELWNANQQEVTLTNLAYGMLTAGVGYDHAAQKIDDRMKQFTEGELAVRNFGTQLALGNEQYVASQLILMAAHIQANPVDPPAAAAPAGGTTPPSGGTTSVTGGRR